MMENCRIYLCSLGCRLNQSEIETMARQFTAAGHIVVGDSAQADICVVNTCAVTAEAERKSRHRVRSLARANPEARIAVVGCYATLAPQYNAALPGVAWVVSNAEKQRAVEGVAVPPPPSSSPNFWGGGRECRGEGVRAALLRTRAFVKVQDGCDNHCTYCIVRLLRGPACSRPVDSLVAEVQAGERLELGGNGGVGLGDSDRQTWIRQRFADVRDPLPLARPWFGVSLGTRPPTHQRIPRALHRGAARRHLENHGHGSDWPTSPRQSTARR